MNPTAKAYRVSKLNTSHATARGALSGAGQTLAAVASATGVSQDLCERQLSVLVDEGLATRTRGSRLTATYALS